MEQTVEATAGNQVVPIFFFQYLFLTKYFQMHNKWYGFYVFKNI